MTEKDFVGMATCFICGEVKHLLLDKRIKKTLPRSACYDEEPCDKCKEVMKKGVFFIRVRDGETGQNPYRTGKIIGLKEEAVKRLVTNKKLLEDILKKRICYIEDKTFKILGLDKLE